MITIDDLLFIEDDPSVLSFRCGVTGVPIWSQIRISLFRMLLSDLLYGSAPVGGPTRRVSPTRALSTMSKAIILNTRSGLRGNLRADICFFSAGVANQLVDGKWLNRLSDHFALSCQARTLTVEDHFEWTWRFPRHNPRVISHAPRQAVNTFAAAALARESHRQQASGLVRLLAERCSQRLNWTLGREREAWLVSTLAGRTAAMPWQFRAYQRMLGRIKPSLLMIAGACYGGPMATLVAAARNLNIVTAEFQHGSISAGHDAYNFAPAVRESEAFKRILPDYFLGYGQWWNDQINVPVKKIAIGNPHREAHVGNKTDGSSIKDELLILSDGMEFGNYLKLAQQLEVGEIGQRLKVVIRPHPIERSAIVSEHGSKVGRIFIDNRADFYASLNKADTVISEISTGLFEALGVVENAYLWETPKSKFTYPSHPFTSFAFASEITKIQAGRVKPSIELFWSNDWRGNFRKFLNSIDLNA